MKKIETLFLRDAKGRAIDAVNPGCEWVLAGEGTPTRKVDGTCCLVLGGRLYKRMEWDAQKGPAPEVWLHHSFNHHQRSGHGWYPVGEGPEDWMHRKAWPTTDAERAYYEDGTYELIGECIGKNPEGCEDGEFKLVKHGLLIPDVAQRTFETLRAFLTEYPMEGIVWHRNDGEMVKLKRRDFGIPWPVLVVKAAGSAAPA